MESRKIIWIFILSFLGISLYSCKTEEIILHSDIRGLVTDSTTTAPIQAASVKLINTNDTTSTGSDGIYIFKNIAPGSYDIQASKYLYAPYKENVNVVSAETKEIDIHLREIAVPNISVSFLDFGLDSTTLSFSISKVGKGNLTFIIAPSQPWINVSPAYGNITSEIENITVSINKTGLSDSIYKEAIKVISLSGQDIVSNIIMPVYLNGVADRDGNYYKIVKIGTQIWMAQNLNVGSQIGLEYDQKDNDIIEKYCYSNITKNCDIYGGLYNWPEAMQYDPSDNGIIGTTQGICPDGWHIPTHDEWYTLFVYLGGPNVAGGKLKDKSTLWQAPNTGATNESGFSGLPGGQVATPDDFHSKLYFTDESLTGYWWYSQGSNTFLKYDDNYAYLSSGKQSSDRPSVSSYSVRCVKDRPKNK